MIKSFQTSMGQKDNRACVLILRLLGMFSLLLRGILSAYGYIHQSTDASAALTLRCEMLEAIHHKFPRSPNTDDMQWPLVTAEGVMLPPSHADTNFSARKCVNRQLDFEDESDENLSTSPLKSYWESIRARYRSHCLSPSALSASQRMEMMKTNI